MKLSRSLLILPTTMLTMALLAGCNKETPTSTETQHPAVETASEECADFGKARVNPSCWPKLEPLPLDPEIEAKIDSILPKLTLEQKVGQIIQGDTASLTPEDVKTYRLGSVLSGGNSAPSDKEWADTQAWLAMADKYYEASIDPEGVEIAIPMIWGIDAVHGHANLTGAIVFPHNIGLGAANNPDLIEQVAKVTAFELTVSGHDWTFAPTVALPQDLRWGRSYEGFSEDPAIVNAYADRVVYGLQGRRSDDDFMGNGRVISSAKHFLGDGGTRNGVDQGDADISEKSLVEIHGAGYYSAIPAGVQTVMASFSSWQGSKLHGDKELLTDVLKGQLGFTGFVVGDWNGHGQVPGCTNTDCAQSINAGVDMFMAPDSWKGLYHSTLQHVKDGTIPMARLDDAVRRILRVKIASGLFEKGAPSQRANAGNADLLGLPEHRAIARQAVRESMVLLKNNNQVLPLDASKTVLVIGDGADNVSKPAGGWTLKWQGGVLDATQFPNSQTILSGIEDAVKAAGGKVIFSKDGNTSEQADVVVAVYGEDPYAEFQGDRSNLKLDNDGFDTSVLKSFKQQNIPVVSVFLSGRPMWVNPEINASDAFVAAFLPGSEGGGVADLLFKTDTSYDFTGRLSFSWPNSAFVPQNYEAKPETLFPLGYGLSYGDNEQLAALSEDSGLNQNQDISVDLFYEKGLPVAPWTLTAHSRGSGVFKTVDSYPTSISSLIISKTDNKAQEDALKLNWTSASGGEQLRLGIEGSVDLSRQANGALALSFDAKSFSGSADIIVGMGCSKDANDCIEWLPLSITSSDWQTYGISLNCFEQKGIDMKAINTAILLSANNAADIGIGHIRLEQGPAANTCPSE